MTTATTQTTAPKLELRNVKYAAFQSQETHCYEATLYVDGKKFAIVSNDGHGGCDRQSPISPVTWADLRALEARLKDQPRKAGVSDYEASLECVCGDLMNKWLVEREAKKTLKRVCYTRHDKPGIFLLQSKFKPTAATFAALRGAPWADKIKQILNELPEAEAVAMIVADAEAQSLPDESWGIALELAQGLLAMDPNCTMGLSIRACLLEGATSANVPKDQHSAFIVWAQSKIIG